MSPVKVPLRSCEGAGELGLVVSPGKILPNKYVVLVLANSRMTV